MTKTETILDAPPCKIEWWTVSPNMKGLRIMFRQPKTPVRADEEISNQFEYSSLGALCALVQMPDEANLFFCYPQVTPMDSGLFSAWLESIWVAEEKAKIIPTPA